MCNDGAYNRALKNTTIKQTGGKLPLTTAILYFYGDVNLPVDQLILQVPINFGFIVHVFLSTLYVVLLDFF